MSGSELNPQPAGLAGVLSATSTFRGYRTAAIVTYVISDLALVAAAVVFLTVDLKSALAIGVVAVFFTLLALRCGQIVLARSVYEDRIPSAERLEFEFGARRAVALSALRSPLLVLITDQAVHVFRVDIIPREAIARASRNDGASLRQSPTQRSGDVELRIGTHSLGLRGVSGGTIEQVDSMLR